MDILILATLLVFGMFLFAMGIKEENKAKKEKERMYEEIRQTFINISSGIYEINDTLRSKYKL